MVPAASLWTPPAGPLGRLCDRARERARSLDLGALVAAAQERVTSATDLAPSMEAALKGTSVAVIAEIKRRSPSKGGLNEGMSASDRARAYAIGGAKALSVLTEPDEFGGSMTDLALARGGCALPLLKKDFHVAPVQVWEARVSGASALLLIARGLGADGLSLMMKTAREAGIEALVEVRSEHELGWAIEAGASLVGVNCRDLETLLLETEVHDRLLPLIPPNCIAIAESGVSTRADVERLAGLGADAVLVGSALSRAADPEFTVSTLAGVSRVRRAS